MWPVYLPRGQKGLIMGSAVQDSHAVSVGHYFIPGYKLYTKYIQYWPKVTHAKKRTSHAGCNARDARFRRVLHRICYSNVAHHVYNICVGCARYCSGSMWHAWDAHFWRVCHPFMYCRIARDHGLLLVSTVLCLTFHSSKVSGSVIQKIIFTILPEYENAASEVFEVNVRWLIKTSIIREVRRRLKAGVVLKKTYSAT
jgi:hypothetical protein